MIRLRYTVLIIHTIYILCIIHYNERNIIRVSKYGYNDVCCVYLHLWFSKIQLYYPQLKCNSRYLHARNVKLVVRNVNCCGLSNNHSQTNSKIHNHHGKTIKYFHLIRLILFCLTSQLLLIIGTTLLFIVWIGSRQRISKRRKCKYKKISQH